MGFTHYWLRKASEDENYERFKEDAIKLIEYGVNFNLIDSQGILHDDKRILFRGPCESFFWPRNPVKENYSLDEAHGGGFFFCKTNRYEYDKLICALLIRAKYHYKDDVSISSDGNWDLDWCEGLELYKEIFNASGNVESILDSE